MTEDDDASAPAGRTIAAPADEASADEPQVTAPSPPPERARSPPAGEEEEPAQFSAAAAKASVRMEGGPELMEDDDAPAPAGRTIAAPADEPHATALPRQVTAPPSQVSSPTPLLWRKAGRASANIEPTPPSVPPPPNENEAYDKLPRAIGPAGRRPSVENAPGGDGVSSSRPSHRPADTDDYVDKEMGRIEAMRRKSILAEAIENAELTEDDGAPAGKTTSAAPDEPQTTATLPPPTPAPPSRSIEPGAQYAPTIFRRTPSSMLPPPDVEHGQPPGGQTHIPEATLVIENVPDERDTVYSAVQMTPIAPTRWEQHKRCIIAVFFVVVVVLIASLTVAGIAGMLLVGQRGSGGGGKANSDPSPLFGDCSSRVKEQRTDCSGGAECKQFASGGCGPGEREEAAPAEREWDCSALGPVTVCTSDVTCCLTPAPPVVAATTPPAGPKTTSRPTESPHIAMFTNQTTVTTPLEGPKTTSKPTEPPPITPITSQTSKSTEAPSVAPPTNKVPLIDVLIVGAGIAGLSCGYNLDILNIQTEGEIDIQILEARSKVGGRLQNVKDEADFIDFDLDMGGQDLFFHDFAAYKNLLSNGEPFPYTAFSWGPSEVDHWKCYRFEDDSYVCDDRVFHSDLDEASFENSSLATFVTDNFLPRVADKVHLNSVVTEINYQDKDNVIATTSDGRTFEANQLVVAVPLSQLKKGAITFDPPLPSSYTSVIGDSRIKEGARIWVEFSEKFYKEVTEINGRTYWDAARGKSTNKNIITIPGWEEGWEEPALATMSDEDVLAEVLRDLDIAYADQVGYLGKANETFVDYFVKNWSKEQYIEMANADRDHEPENLRILKEPVDDRIWFAGDYTLRGRGNEAAESGKFIAGKVFQEHAMKPGLCEYYRARDLIFEDEICFSVSDKCEAAAHLEKNGQESCDAWCARSGLTCTKAWNDGAFCQKRNEIDCDKDGKGVSICQCGVGLCQSFLAPVDLIEADEICSGTPDECEALASLYRNNNESCDEWCQRQGLTCTGAWDNGGFCEKLGEIPCGRTGNKKSICQCKE